MKLEELKEAIMKEILEEDIAAARSVMKRKYREISLIEYDLSKRRKEIEKFEGHIKDGNLHLIF